METKYFTGTSCDITENITFQAEIHSQLCCNDSDTTYEYTSLIYFLEVVKQGESTNMFSFIYAIFM
jgi:hypothetical protein